MLLCVCSFSVTHILTLQIRLNTLKLIAASLSGFYRTNSINNFTLIFTRRKTICEYLARKEYVPLSNLAGTYFKNA